MICKEKWSPRALADFSDIVGYILSRWSEKEALNYIARVEDCISMIKKMPEMFKISRKRKKVRQCVISSQTSLYYRISGDTLEIIALFDTRQNPEKLKIVS